MALQANFAKQAKTNAIYGSLPATGFVRIASLRPIVPFSYSTLWRRVRTGTFPAPVKISERITAWRVEDIRAWLDQQASGGACT